MLDGAAMLKVLPDLLEKVGRFLERRRTAKSERTSAHRQAIKSVLEAVLATERYVYDRKKGARVSSRHEARLASLWSRAAVDIQAVDARVSRLALLTSFTWANPDLLDDPKYRDVPKQLALIREQCGWLLDPGT